MKTRSVAIALIVVVASVAASFAQTATASRKVAIVTDQIPLMEVLAAGLQSAENIVPEIVTQAQLPANLAAYSTVIASVEGDLQPLVAKALQDYTKMGGRLVLLHNSIAPNKTSTPDWLPFVGVKFNPGTVAAGGFQRIPNAKLELAQLSHRNFVIENKVTYTNAVSYKSASRAKEMNLPGLSFPATESFVNHVFTRLKQSLMGIKVTDPASGVTYMQDTGIWFEPIEKGQLYYFMPGSAADDFKNAAYVRMIANAIITQL